MAPLAWVAKLATRWRHLHELTYWPRTRWHHLHEFKYWPPDGATCKSLPPGCVTALPDCVGMPYWHYQLVLSWYLHQPESHQLSWTKPLLLRETRTHRSDQGHLGPIKNMDRSIDLAVQHILIYWVLNICIEHILFYFTIFRCRCACNVDM